MTTSIDQLLRDLSEERSKYSKADQGRMQKIIDSLVALGAYPKTTPMMQKNGHSHLDMVVYPH